MAENYNTIWMAKFVPFENAMMHKSKVLKELHYYSQLALEFYLIHTGLPPNTKLCLPYIKANMDHTLLRKRTAEMNLIGHELDSGNLGIDFEDHETIWQAHHVLRTTLNYCFRALGLELEELHPRTPTTSKQLASLVNQDIRGLEILLHDSALQDPILPKLIELLGLCNQNLNKVIVPA